VLSAVPDGDDELVDALWLGGHHDRAVRGGSTGFERCCATAALIASDELEAAESAIDEIERSATAAGDEPLLAVVELLRRRCRSVRSEAEPASELFPGPDPGPEPRPETNSARAVAFLDHGGIEAIEQAVALLRESPRHGLLAGALLDLGRELRHAGRRCKARAALREALDLAQRLDCHELADQARDELRIAGARPRRERLSGPASLTAAEWRVARAAANGITNREIAAQLFLSPKTVEMHLGRIYRKLDVASRAEMTGALELRPLAAAA
jgi:DNA-binding CsgD family transcriptional regulator